MKRITELLSLARKDFLENTSYESEVMKEVYDLFNSLAQTKYEVDFHWSDYNRRGWEYFVSHEYGAEGGLATFSLETAGRPSEEEKIEEFKGFGLGKPLGTYPFSIFYLNDKKDSDSVCISLAKEGFSSSILG